MPEFIRVSSGYINFDQIRPDPAVGDYVSDDFDVPPYLPPGLTYLYMKTILVRVLGRRAFNTLVQGNVGHVEHDIILLAFTIILFYMQRGDGISDLQTTLIVNLLAKRTSGLATNISDATNRAFALIGACGFDSDYQKHIEHVLIAENVMHSPWWVNVNY